MSTLHDLFSPEELESYYLTKLDELVLFLDEFETIEAGSQNAEFTRRLMRCVHSLKGHFLYYRDNRVIDFFHFLESFILNCSKLDMPATASKALVNTCLEQLLLLFNELASGEGMSSGRRVSLLHLSNQLQTCLEQASSKHALQ